MGTARERMKIPRREKKKKMVRCDDKTTVSLLMHASLRCAVPLMSRQQARQQAGVQLWRVTIIDGNLRRPYRADQMLDHLVDLCFQSGGDESRAFLP